MITPNQKETLASKEAWLSELDIFCQKTQLHSRSYAFLYKKFQLSLAANPSAVYVHINYVRYQVTQTTDSYVDTDRRKINDALNWINAQTRKPGFDWNSMLQYFRILSEKEVFRF